MVGLNRISRISSASIITNTIHPSSGNASDNWFILALEPILAEGEAAGSLIGRPSTRLPDFTGVMLCSQLMSYLEATFNTYKVAIADGLGLYLCESPIRMSITTEFGTSNRLVSILQLF